MANQYFIGISVVFLSCILNVSSFPSNEPEEGLLKWDIPADESEETDDEGRSLTYNISENEDQQESTKDIIEKIKVINDGLKKPYRQFNFNHPHPQNGPLYVLDKDTLEKLKQIIAAGKLHVNQNREDEGNSVTNDENGRYSKALQYIQPTTPTNVLSNSAASMIPMPYLTAIPAIVMPVPSFSDGSSNDIQTNMYQTRQKPPSLPFNIQWPLAPLFPILIKDPLVHYLANGGFNNVIEYGQTADVCNRKQKSKENNDDDQNNIETEVEPFDALPMKVLRKSRQGRAIKKRNIAKSSSHQEVHHVKKQKKFFTKKPVETEPVPVKKPVKYRQPEPEPQIDTEGDIRTPFGDFNLFGNRRPVAPSPGFFINRLKVRRGGVAIAGPGGVATAGRGGTAVVGPGGLAYTQPGGLAVAGPAARVVALSSDTDLDSIVRRLQQQSATDASVPRLLEAIPEGKVVATGPVVYYHPTKSLQESNNAYFGGWRDYGRETTGSGWRSVPYGFVKTGTALDGSPFLVYMNPIAQAVNARGVAIANPISQVLVAHDRAGTIVYNPTATAVVGPGGIAHAQSDLYVYENVTA